MSHNLEKSEYKSTGTVCCRKSTYDGEEEGPDNDCEIRIIIRACVLDIPGRIEDRAKTLGHIFVLQEYDRSLNCTPTNEAFDAVHILEPQMSRNPVRAWFMYDLNVTQARSETEQSRLRHKAYLACYDGANL